MGSDDTTICDTLDIDSCLVSKRSQPRLFLSVILSRTVTRAGTSKCRFLWDSKMFQAIHCERMFEVTVGKGQTGVNGLLSVWWLALKALSPVVFLDSVVNIDRVDMQSDWPCITSVLVLLSATPGTLYEVLHTHFTAAIFGRILPLVFYSQPTAQLASKFLWLLWYRSWLPNTYFDRSMLPGRITVIICTIRPKLSAFVREVHARENPKWFSTSCSRWGTKNL